MRWRWLAALVALWAMLIALLLLGLYPALPETAGGWLLLVAAGPPAYLAVELVAGKLLSREAGVRLSAKRFSWKRILVALLVALALASLLTLALTM